MNLDVAGLTGTGLLATVSEDTSGGGLGGSFCLYSNGGSPAGFPIDAEGGYVSTEDKVNNGTGRSEPLQWNAAADDVRVAIEGLLPTYVSEGNLKKLMFTGGTCMPKRARQSTHHFFQILVERATLRGSSTWAREPNLWRFEQCVRA